MSTIKLSTAYQLILTSLLFGACLGIVSRQTPLIVSTSLPSVSAMVADELPMAANSMQFAAIAAGHNDRAATITAQPTTSAQMESAQMESAQMAVDPHTIAGIDVHAHAIDEKNSVDGTLSPIASMSLQAAGPTSPNTNKRLSARPSTTPFVMIGAELVNLRSAPGLSAPVVGHAQVGQQLQIIGRDPTSSWWLVCCYNERLVWVSAHVVTAYGNFSDTTVIPTSTAMVGRDAAALPLSLSNDKLNSSVGFANVSLVHTTDSFPYELVQQRQYGEQLTPRLFVYVNDKAFPDREEGIPNLGLLVKKDGVLLSAPYQTHGGQPDFTWPIPTARQQLANLKIEFSHIDPSGRWAIQLIDATGQPIGPVAHFLFAPNEPNMEMYLHYQK